MQNIDTAIAELEYIKQKTGYADESFDMAIDALKLRKALTGDDTLWRKLKDHFGHKVEIAVYGDPENPDSICLEDMDTNEVVLDAEIYTLCSKV